MSSGDTPSLVEQRHSLRLQLQAQRLLLAGKLAPVAGGSYPRSMTMRLLINQPALLAKLASLMAGPRHAGVQPAVLALARMLPSVLAAAQSKPGIACR